MMNTLELLARKSSGRILLNLFRLLRRPHEAASYWQDIQRECARTLLPIRSYRLARIAVEFAPISEFPARVGEGGGFWRRKILCVSAKTRRDELS
jgi:hypothetical protein